ncbi:MAG TPA: ABC transporter permease, partial [Tianweitania sediminis]|nr:ABC transporter permease [Tianweitania sediminis]
MTRLGPPLAVLLLGLPVLIGLLGTILPAFGILPALGGVTPSLAPFEQLLAMPGVWRSAALSFWIGLASGAGSLFVVMLFVAG